MSAQATVLIVPGLNGSGPDHWQTRWEEERIDCVRVQQDDWQNPDPLGCIAVGAWATLSKSATDRRIEAMMVAPCDPVQEGAVDAIRRFGAIALGRLPFPSTLIASSNDPYASFSRGCRFASDWGSQLIDAGEGGHLNAQSGLGSWRWGQRILDRMVSRLKGA
jgi:uncharacterized protein